MFHFLGHGDDDGLYFENEHGEGQLVKGHELKEALAKSPVKLALLNACWSATKRGVSLIEFLTREQVAEVAIGHETPVADVSAVEFSKQFYTFVTQGDSIRVACQRAASSLAEQGKSGATDVKLVGNRDAVLTTGLVSGSRPCVIETGLPTLVHLPEPPAFYGRGEELVQLSQSFADVTLSGFGLWGIGGIGKTALAKVAARRNAWRYDAASWVDIRDVPIKTTVELLRMALVRMHRGAPDDDPVEELCRRMQESPSLIVLDNLEDLPETEHAALARFIQQVPKNGSRVLMTARVPLPDIERLSDVQSRRMTEGLDTWSGAAMVQRVAEQKKCEALRNELRFENSRPVGLCVHITNRLHGHPKMLELAVGVGLKGRAELEQALVALPDDLEEQLGALLATSLKFLGDDGNRVLPLLSFFPTGNLTPESLMVVGQAASLSVRTESAELTDSDEETEPDLTWLNHGRDQLVAAGLLDYDQEKDVFTFHQSILDEAYRRRPSDEVRGAIVGALLMHFVEYINANQSNNELLDRCFENAVTMMESLWSARSGEGPLDTILATMAENLGSYFHIRGFWRLGQSWHERAIELHRSSGHAKNESRLAHELFQQAQLLASRGEFAAARTAITECLTLSEMGANQRGIGAALYELARIESSQGNPSEARRLLQRSQTIDESLGDQRGLSASLHELARIESSQGNPSEARRLLQRSQTILESLGDQRGLSASLHELARIESSQGNPSEARRLLQRSQTILESLGYQVGLSASLHELAIIESSQGNPSEARRLLQRSLTIKESLGDQRGLSAALHQLAIIEYSQGNPSEARRLLQRSLTIKESLGDQLGLSASLHQLAIIESSQGNPSEARRLLQRSLTIKESLGDQLGFSASLHQLAIIEYSQGNPSEARKLWEQAVSIDETLGDVVGAARTRCMLAQLEAMEGKFEKAIDLARSAVQVFEQLGYSEVEQARDILRAIENLAAQTK